jgi:hypothetical protein
MSDQNLSLPLRLERGAQLKIIAFALLGMFVLVCFALLALPTMRDSLGLPWAILIIAVLGIGDTAAMIILMHAIKPAIIDIDRGLITLRPLSVLGLPSPVVEKDFPRTAFLKVTSEAMGQGQEVCVLEPRPNMAERINFAPPAGFTAQQCAAQLNQLLDYKG